MQKNICILFSFVVNKKYLDIQGMSPLISKEGMNQLSIFIFVLALVQIVSSVATMALGRAKVC